MLPRRLSSSCTRLAAAGLRGSSISSGGTGVRHFVLSSSGCGPMRYGFVAISKTISKNSVSSSYLRSCFSTTASAEIYGGDSQAGSNWSVPMADMKSVAGGRGITSDAVSGPRNKHRYLLLILVLIPGIIYYS